MQLIGKGSFGYVYSVGNRTAVKVYGRPPPAYFEKTTLPKLQHAGGLANACFFLNSHFYMPEWGPTVWDIWGAAQPPYTLAIELRRCLVTQLKYLETHKLVHTDIKGANVATTGAWPNGSPPPVLSAERRFLCARDAGLHGPGFIVIDLDAICPFELLAESDRGTLCPFGPMLEDRCKTPLLATYAMWFAAAAVVAGFTPASQIRSKIEFVSQHEQLILTGMLPPLPAVLEALDSLSFFTDLDDKLCVPGQ